MEKQEFAFRIVIEVEYKDTNEEDAQWAVENYLERALDGESYSSVTVPHIRGRIVKVVNRKED